jgi:hypothetical protein
LQKYSIRQCVIIDEAKKLTSLEIQIKEQSKKMVLIVVLNRLKCLVVDIHNEPVESLVILLFYNGIYMTCDLMSNHIGILHIHSLVRICQKTRG